MEHLVPLRNSLCIALDQPRGAWSGMGAPGPPRRLAPCRSQPTLRDLTSLRDAVSAMHLALGKLNSQLADVLDPGGETIIPPGGFTTEQLLEDAPSTACSTTQEICRREADLNQELTRLRARADELEESEARCRDLNSVADQLRVRVTELERREASAGTIRDECASLRVRIAELVAGQVQVTMLEQDRADLQAQLQILESNGHVAAGDREEGSYKLTPPNSASLKDGRGGIDATFAAKFIGATSPGVPCMVVAEARGH